MEEEILNGKTLLVVDDEVDLRDIIASEMEFMGAKVFQAGNIAAAKDVLKAESIDLIVSDIRMPGGTGVDLLDYVKAQDSRTPPVILITGFADITLEDALNKGAEALLSKPFKLDDLVKTIERYTKPVEQRFNETNLTATQSLDIDFDETLEAAIDRRDFLIGRGGAALRIGTQRKKIQVGEPLDFNFKFKDRQFKGCGFCRWIKVQEGGGKASVGIEFINFNNDDLNFFLEYWKQHPAVTYIPVP